MSLFNKHKAALRAKTKGIGTVEDYVDAMKAAENGLRDLIEEVLQAKHGDSWVEKTGETQERVEQWRDRREEERRRIPDRAIDERLLYYSQFYSLSTILKKNWTLFEPIFGSWDTMRVFLGKLEDYRNPDAHKRELLPYEKNLILGMTGFIRNAITKYRSGKEPTDEFFPYFEYITDSLGCVWRRGEGVSLHTKKVLRPGDEVVFNLKAWDPKGEPLVYGIDKPAPYGFKSEVPTLTWKVTRADIGKTVEVSLDLTSKREYHASGGHDDLAIFFYTVLPK